MNGPWPGVEQWLKILPGWFVDACAGEDETMPEEPYPTTVEESRAQFYREKWKLSSWVSWMEPEDRRWLWLDAEALDADTLLVHVDRVGDPCDLGEPPGVWWLFAASGATEFDEVGILDDLYRVRVQQRSTIA